MPVSKALCFKERIITIIELSGLLLGLISVGLSWYFGTANKRLRTKITEYEKSISKIEKYSSNTGYKTMLHDCFHIITYVGGVILFLVGVKTALLTFITNDFTILIIEQFLAGIFIGSGVILLKLFVLLSRANKPENSLKDLKVKVEQLRAGE